MNTDYPLDKMSSSKDWCETFKSLYDPDIMQFEAIFLYGLIRLNVSLNDFRSILKLVNQSDNRLSTYIQFFNNSSEGAREIFFSVDRYDNDFSVWFNISNIFHDKEGLCEKTLPYMMAMIEDMPGDAFHGDEFYNYMDIYRDNLSALLPIIKIAQHSAIKEKFMDYLLDFVAWRSLSYQDSDSVYNLLDKVIENFSAQCEHSFFSGNHINHSMHNFLFYAGKDWQGIVHRKYKENKEDINFSAKVGVSKSLETLLQDKDFSPNWSLVDRSASLEDNFIIFKIWRLSQKEIPPEICDYLASSKDVIESVMDEEILEVWRHAYKKALPFILEGDLCNKPSTKKVKL